MAQQKSRVDERVLADGLAPDARTALALILRGDVLINGKPATAAGTKVKDSDSVTLKSGALGCPFVSRGGLKLDFALKAFGVNAQGKAAIDVGASTGGFTDVLLQAGAKRVFAVDVAYGELAWKVRSDPRVTVLDRINARHLPPEKIDEAPDMIVCDVSFISLKRALPPALSLLKPGGSLITLIKPQFEADKESADAGEGIILDAAIHKDVCLDICDWAPTQGLMPLAMCRSPILGRKGNVEYLLMAVKNGG